MSLLLQKSETGYHHGPMSHGWILVVAGGKHEYREGETYREIG